MSRKRPTEEGDELLARLRSLTAQVRERAEVQRSRVELAIALQHGSEIMTVRPDSLV